MITSLARVFSEHRAFTPRLRALLKLYITPLVLIAGVIVLMFYHFRGVLKLTATQDIAFHGLIAYSQGPLSMSFAQNAGIQRPYILYNNKNLLTYSDWDSIVSVDGVTQSLWNSTHGYSSDDAKRQIFSTSTGQNWQVVEVATLVDQRTVRVTFSFVSRATLGNPPGSQFEIDLAHQHTAWYNPAISGNTFTADVVNQTSGQIQNQLEPTPDGVIHVTLSGPAVTSGALQLGALKTVAGPKGLVTLTSQFMTRYTLTNPPANVLIPLATETITFTPGQSTPIGPAPTPAGS